MGILFFLLIVFLPFTPITLKIDSYKKKYYLEIWGLAKCSMVWQDGIVLKVKMPFYGFDFDPFAPKTSKKEDKKSIKSTRAKKRTFKSIKRFYRFLRTFQIREFRVDLDTSDVIWNAYLYPVFYLVNSNKRKMTINNEGRLGIIIYLKNNMSRIIWASIK